ncbi:DUF3179 domain-containing protein [Acanthopleuribacter pedis]|uniref:DUF3179 domain-containing protein n=2 Tax=Acanthopleuribacter pedis TaxID=442870 RepID=A0A8J7Q0H0_9BACT|nr:DUF3179 domain-containing protein [Acanthopleuribacter pedis]
MLKYLTLLLVGAFFGLPLPAQEAGFRTLEDLKQQPGFSKLLDRGKIPAVYQPTFVQGKDADMPADAWVIGVYHGGEAKAYSINLLNKHEIVNDFVGDKPIATTW